MSLLRSILLAQVLFLSLVHIAVAQTEISFEFTDQNLTQGKPIKLQAFEYVPKNWNGKVILFSHGSTGGSRDAVKEPLKFLNISKFALDNGYIFITYMRKGRGGSEGTFTEEGLPSRCDAQTNTRETQEAELQIEQVIKQTKIRHSVNKVILMGHSRGGYLSATYGSSHPNDVLAIVNLAGVWNAACESTNGNASRVGLKSAAEKFQKQYWAYFEDDSYFKVKKFWDPNYAWISKTAQDNGLVFEKFSSANRKDGHEAPTWVPKEWATEFFPLLNAQPKE